MATNDQWLAQVVEQAIEPDLPICDPHHHLWGHRPERVAHRYLLDDFLVDLDAGHNIVSTVFIECGAMYRSDGPVELRPVGETEFVNGIAAMSASGLYGHRRVAAGIVGHADLMLGEAVEGVLEAHIVAGGGRFRGIRHGATWDESPEIPDSRCAPPPHMYANDAFRRGFGRLQLYGLSFEAWCYHTQLADLIGLARDFPGVTIVLDHFGGPLGIGRYAGKHDEIMPGWRRDIAELAKCPNVVAKLGGINMELNGFGWHERGRPPSSDELLEATRPWYEYTIEQFGMERCLFESNFPVDMVSCSYTVLWNSFKKLVSGCSREEKARLFHDNAVAVYRL